ncbi:MAG: hypothetical protein F4146_02375 [Rhodothermaceae bacterium]|nr:hypothetical protein [Rhodothermaceae bacterium]
MIPEVGDLKSSAMTHRFGDCFSPAGLTNFLGVVQAVVDLTGLRCLNFPPFGTSDTVSGTFVIDGRHFPSLGIPVTFTWYPDRILREASYKGFHYTSVTALALNKMSAVTEITIENRTGETRKIEVGLRIQGRVTKSTDSWAAFLPPQELNNTARIDHERGAVVFSAQQSRAVSIQGMYPRADSVRKNGFRYVLNLHPGEKQQISYVSTIAETESEAHSAYDKLIRDVTGELDRVRDILYSDLKEIYTPGNGRYAGHLPELDTTDTEIRKLYWMGALGVIYFRRDSSFSVLGRTYDTLMPRYWQTVTFIWDYFLSMQVHALLDPGVMRKYLEHWMCTDTHQHFGTEYLTGGPVGNWYSVNDFAMVSMVREYTRWTGDLVWLEKPVAGTNKRVIDFLGDYAQQWKNFQSANKLADYGGINNLLECVSTYTHEVASLNVANVHNMRVAADLMEASGRGGPRSDKLRQESERLLEAVQSLYVETKGYWQARHPDGEMYEVRHCYDLLTVLNTIPDDLSEQQKAEMVSFFKREIQTATWMRALSPADENVLFDVRPDHQWTGAYPAWPSETARGLYRIGAADLAFNWLKGLARSANQGPFAQAHFADGVVNLEEGGASKAPSDTPYITDWACSSSGSWVTVILEGIFGLRASLTNGLTAKPQFASFDPRASLRNIAYQGDLYTVTKDGITSQN